MKTGSRARRRKIDLERTRSRLYAITLDGDDKEAIQAARVLLKDYNTGQAEEVDDNLLMEVVDALRDTGARPFNPSPEDPSGEAEKTDPGLF